MYTSIAAYVYFNRFIDLEINIHTNPYNLASSRLLWFWAPCSNIQQCSKLLVINVAFVCTWL